MNGRVGWSRGLWLLLVLGAGGCAAPADFTACATVEVPGLSPQEMDQNVARPTGATLFRASGGVREVLAVSTAGRARFYATSERGTKREEFLQSVTEAMSGAAPTLPAGASAGPVQLLAPGQAIPDVPARPVGRIVIDFDRAKMIDAGLTVADVTRAIGRTREAEADETGAGSDAPGATGPATGATTGSSVGPSARRRLDRLAATTLPSRSGRLTLGDVATLRVVREPDRVVRRWP